MKFYLEEGAKITGIHRVLKFRQEAWIKEYIDYNTLKRQQATNKIEKDFHKLLNNAYFGKCIESVCKRVNIVLIESKKRQQFQVSKPGFKRFEIFDD